jgi:hypothetical protein
LSSIDERFRVGYLLDTLRQDVGDSEFGYRCQALLAHVLLRIGGKVLDIRPQGHPDITASIGVRRLLLQVKAVHGKTVRQNFSISPEDLNGIKPANKDIFGYFAILECVPPISWILVDYSRLYRQGSKPLSMVALRATENRKLSQELTEEFVRLVVDNQNRLRDLGFHILCVRALRGEPF